MNRRNFILMGSVSLLSTPISAFAGNPVGLPDLCRKLEQESGGRLGVYLFDGRDGQEFLYRSTERFPMCSTFKWLLAAAVLEKVDSGQERLDRLVHFGKLALLEYSPITKTFADGPGISIAELCHAAVAQSDNTAANLLLDVVGGPQGFNSFLRAKGDVTTRLDRVEPELNEAIDGDLRDTSTPQAMGADLRHLVLGQGLEPALRRSLRDWMLDTRTSGARLRAGLESGWLLADKTGTGENGTANDVGVYWTPGGEPIVLCVFLTRARSTRKAQEQLISSLGQAVRSRV